MLFVPNWLMCLQDISSTEKLLYARLCQYAGEKGFCFPKQDTIANEIGVKVGAIKKGLQRLQDNGLIEIKRRGLGKPNVCYFLHHPSMETTLQEVDKSTL